MCRDRVLYTGGTFDLFHYGHLKFLKNCKQIADKVVVSLNTDSFVEQYKSKTVLSYEERRLSLLHCQYVDEVIPFETEQDLVDMILTINPDIRIVGEEYKDKEHTGKGLCNIHYNKRRHSFSSSELRERVIKSK